MPNEFDNPKSRVVRRTFWLMKVVPTWKKVWETLVYRNEIASVKVKFYVVLELPFDKNRIASNELQSPAAYTVR